ncbi:MAG: fimbrillin family protein [Rikenellaceae bacterium]
MRKLTHILFALFVFASCQRGGVVESGLVSGHSAPIVDFVETGELLEAYKSNVASRSSFDGYFEVTNSFGVSAYTLEDGAWDSTTDNADALEIPDRLYNREVTLTDLTDGVDTWEYDDVVQWPVDVNHTVKFFAYFPYTATGFKTSDSDAGYPQVEMPVIADDPAEQVDFLVAATYDDLNKNYGKVDLGFKHALSQITFTANFMLGDSNGVELDDANYGDGWSVQVVGIKIHGMRVYDDAYGEFTDGTSGDDDITLSSGEGFNWIIDYDGDSEEKEYELDSDSGTTNDVVLNYYKTEAHQEGDDPDGEFKTINTYLGALILQPQELETYQVKVLYNLYVEDPDDTLTGYYEVTSSVKYDHEYVAGARTTYAATINPFGGVEIFLPEIDGDPEWEDGGDNDTDLDGGYVPGEPDVDEDDWIDGGGNDNGFGDNIGSGNVGENEGDPEWEDENTNDTELGGGTVPGEPDLDEDDWIDGGGNDNGFGDNIGSGNVGGADGDANWEDENTNDTQLGGGTAPGEPDLDEDNWIDGGGNDNNFSGGMIDGNIGNVGGEEDGWEEENSNDTELGNDSLEGDAGNVGGGENWEDENSNDTSLGNGSVSGDTNDAVTGGDWSGSGGNNNNFDNPLVGGNIGGVGGDDGSWPNIGNSQDIDK